MRINVWGCRGSIARSHPDIVRHGGNTPCCEVEADDGTGTRIVLDLGSGSYDLGQKLVKMGQLKNQVVLLTHTHWDHIQGVPFFAPLFIKGSQWNIHAPGGCSSSIKEKLASQMTHEFFPLSIDAFQADINYHDIKEGSLQFGESFTVTTQYLNHTVLTLGYRIQAADGSSVGYITDHEPFDRRLAMEGYKRTCGEDGGLHNKTPDDRHADFLRGLDLLIHDSQYTADEYPSKEGWGHSTVEYVVDIALSVGVKQLMLFHHDPMRTDAQVDAIVKYARKRVKKAGGSLKVFAAADHESIEISRTKKAGKTPCGRLTKALTNLMKAPSPSMKVSEPDAESVMTTETGESAGASALTAKKKSTLNKAILISYDSETTSDLIRGLAEDGLRAETPEEGMSISDTVLLANATKPAALLVGYTEDALDFCKGVRETGGGWGKDVPFIIIAKDQEQFELLREQGVQAGVTDWVIEPFIMAYIRTRIHMAILRNPCKWIQPVIPKNESSRIATLYSLNLLDTSPEERFDRLTRTCANALGCPISLVSLVDEERNWFKSVKWLCPGPPLMGMTEAPRGVSFCAHAINEADIMVIPDATQDARFAHNPMVNDANGLQVRFYAGCPIRIESCDGDGAVTIGSLCVVDTMPRDLNGSQREMLRDFAAMVKREILSMRE